MFGDNPFRDVYTFLAGRQILFKSNNYLTHKNVKLCVYNINHMYALRIQNTSEGDRHSYEATKAVVKKAQKKL